MAWPSFWSKPVSDYDETLQAYRQKAQTARACEPGMLKPPAEPI
jgi:hypothetical protein